MKVMKLSGRGSIFIVAEFRIIRFMLGYLRARYLFPAFRKNCGLPHRSRSSRNGDR